MRGFLIVLDSFGIGAAPDAKAFGDQGANTLRTIAASPCFHIPNLTQLGLLNIDGINLPHLTAPAQPAGICARLQELSCGKDTTTGHWEMAGIVRSSPLPTFPNGFPQQILSAFSRETGRGVLCNKPYSGTKVIEDYGEAHLSTGDLIVYTSADSVFQIAAHESIVPPETLYTYCKAARRLLTGKWGVGRVIARPFTGEPGHFVRTPRRHDFSLEPPAVTMPDLLQQYGKQVIAVGKIYDIFAGRGITAHYSTENNAQGIAKTLALVQTDFDGLCFTNLVDCDMLYGHRRDIDGYAAAISAFDRCLPALMNQLKENDFLMITADHGCDPGFKGTDHTREDVPLLFYSKKAKSKNAGTRRGFTCVAKTVCAQFAIPNPFGGTSIMEPGENE